MDWDLWYLSKPKTAEKKPQVARLLRKTRVVARKAGEVSLCGQVEARRGVPAGYHGSLARPLRKSTIWRKS